MQTRDIPVAQITVPEGNPNRLDDAMRLHLRHSIERFGLVVPLVVREAGQDAYETVGGAQRLTVLREIGYPAAPCVVVQADDAEAALLSQALNRIQGEDDLGLRAELLRELMATLPEGEVLAILPETAASLSALASLGRQTIADQLAAFAQAQAARLKHFTAQLTSAQHEVVEEAISRFLPQAKEIQDDNPNQRGVALYLMCQAVLKKEGLP